MNQYWAEFLYKPNSFHSKKSQSPQNCWSLGMDEWFHPTLYNGCNYLPMLVIGPQGGSVCTEPGVDVGGKWCLLCQQVLGLPGWKSLQGRGGLNTLRLRQNGCHFPDDIFKCILLNENVWSLLKISLKFLPEVLINSIPALVQIMTWRQLYIKTGPWWLSMQYTIDWQVYTC